MRQDLSHFVSKVKTDAPEVTGKVESIGAVR
jgi:hypothetical protein